jgi:hypothetical protein
MLGLILTGFGTASVAAEGGTTSPGNASVVAEGGTASPENALIEDELQKSLDALQSDWQKFLQASNEVLDEIQSRKGLDDISSLDSKMNPLEAQILNLVKKLEPTGEVSINIVKLIEHTQNRIKELTDRVKGRPEFEEFLDNSKGYLGRLNKSKLDLEGQTHDLKVQNDKILTFKAAAIEYMKDRKLKGAVENLEKAIESTKKYNQEFKDKMDNWFAKTKEQLKAPVIPQ